jgi:hypothetical protein
MLSKIFKLVSIIIFFLYQNSLYSKTTVDVDFNPRYLSNYLSALLAYDNQNNNEAIKYFNSSKNLIKKHEKFLKQYVFSLVLNGQVKDAIKQIKSNKNKNSANFFEAYVLLLVDSLQKQEFEKSDLILNEFQKYQNDGTYQFVIFEILKSYKNLFETKKIDKNVKQNFGKLSLINEAFQNCYLENPRAKSNFLNLINSDDGDYSRYLFFYLSFIIKDKDHETAKQIAQTIDELESNLLINQSKSWINNSKLELFEKTFSCQKDDNILSEFFFLISNFLASEEKFDKSNFYFNISNYLNPKFYFNLTHLVENYYENKNYDSAKEVLKKFNDENDVFYWYKLKKLSQIIAKQQSSEQALSFIEEKFTDILNPSVKVTFDMGNIYKNNGKFEKSIEIYSIVLNQLDEKSDSYAEILYRRGGSFERIGEHSKSDDDLLKSLSIKPNNPYVMNYLAYSWLERKHNIDEAIDMLEKAYQQRKNDPYIIDSIGWGYYLIEDFINAEKFLKRAVELMPSDPIVNDHYGDVLWKLGRKIQARYYWNNTLKLDDVEDEMKKNILKKIIKGVKNI